MTAITMETRDAMANETADRLDFEKQKGIRETSGER